MIGRALRAQARSFAGDVVLLGMVAAALLMSLAVATSIPPDFAEAPAGVRSAFAESFTVVLATYGAVLAAVYGSFRYTIDRRDGVIAQRLMMLPRWTIFVARMPTAALGGAIVALTVVVVGQIALNVSRGGATLDGATVASTLALGAVAGLWGMGLGVVVQVHLVALFVVSMSMSGALLLTMFWSSGAGYLPPLVMLRALGFDVSAMGIPRNDLLESSLALWATAGWVLAALLAGGAAFMKRDVGAETT
ncbi:MULTISPECIES: hypothetical protein [unclassified Microbacterium]|uniref:hypothetical protein n=1 Tax=unclassified Microbacterium TaxID=2609290 RepID=UPI0004937026|nr:MULTISPECIES: hypothetical protein [unclassified Microbacterium]